MCLEFDLAGVPRARINGAIGQLQRLCNVDGYPIVIRDGTDVSLDRELLARQFELAEVEPQAEGSI